MECGFISHIHVDMPFIDAGKQEVIIDEQAGFLMDNGFLVVRNVLAGHELKIVQDEMMKLYEKGAAGVVGDRDYMYRTGGKKGTDVLRPIEYVNDKIEPMKALLGHSFILKSAEKLRQQLYRNMGLDGAEGSG